MQMKSAEKIMHAGISEGIFPGAVLHVRAGDKVVFEQAYGRADIFADRRMTKETLFDLASLTKPLATSLAVMSLVQQGEMGLDDTCVKICPELKNSDKAAITVRQLLNHSSGLPAWRPFFMNLKNQGPSSSRRELMRLLMREPLEHSPGQGTSYSDLGYMLLHLLVERLTEQPLNLYVEEHIYLPLGISHLSFNCLSQPVANSERYAATQLCPWRNRLMIGQVDDDNAWAAGGVAGHAGLFGTADGVGRLLSALVRADQDDDGSGVFDPAQVRLFFNSRPGERWALGFDTPAEHGSSAGRFFPNDSVGHLGFTGTSFWVHRRRRIVVVLLTNRVHPFRFQSGIKDFRPRLHDAVMEILNRESVQSGFGD